MKKIICILLSLIFFVIACVGLILPIIPQVPFFAVSLLLLCVASERMKSMVVNSKLYREHLKKYVEKSKFLKGLMQS